MEKKNKKNEKFINSYELTQRKSSNHYKEGRQYQEPVTFTSLLP